MNPGNLLRQLETKVLKVSITHKVWSATHLIAPFGRERPVLLPVMVCMGSCYHWPRHSMQQLGYETSKQAGLMQTITPNLWLHKANFNHGWTWWKCQGSGGRGRKKPQWFRPHLLHLLMWVDSGVVSKPNTNLMAGAKMQPRCSRQLRLRWLWLLPSFGSGFCVPSNRVLVIARTVHAMWCRVDSASGVLLAAALMKTPSNKAEDKRRWQPITILCVILKSPLGCGDSLPAILQPRGCVKGHRGF